MPGDSSAHLSDPDLLARAQRGDLAAFTTLYLRHRDFVFRIARRHTDSDDAAADAAQETFAYLIRKLPRLKLTGKLSTFLYPVAKNCALTARRKAIGERRKLESAPREPTSADPSITAAPSPAILSALASLPDPQREVLLMRIVDEMSVEEVAAALVIPPGTVKSRLHHALATLRESDQLKSLFP